jgi:hypothetical protein
MKLGHHPCGNESCTRSVLRSQDYLCPQCYAESMARYNALLISQGEQPITPLEPSDSYLDDDSSWSSVDTSY